MGAAFPSVLSSFLLRFGILLQSRSAILQVSSELPQDYISFDINFVRCPIYYNPLPKLESFKTANILQINIVAAAQLGSLEGSDLHKQEQFEVRRILDRKAAVDVCIIITVFLLCYLPEWITNTLFYFNKKKFLLEIIPFTRCIFYVSSLTNPIIYSIRKREFRAGVRRMLKRIGRLCGVTFILDNKNGVNSSTTQASFQRASSRAYFEAVQEDRPREVILSVETLEGPKGFRMNFEKCLSPIEEGTE